MGNERGLTYAGTGVDVDLVSRELEGLARILAPSAGFRRGVGEAVMENGYYATALRLTADLALGLCTDGVGSKILVAERMGKYDTVGIDCIAMNVNDLVCIGAEPIAMVDYVGIERLQPGMLAEIAKGLLEGARQANISIPGGETAQLPEVIRGQKPGHGLDLVGTAVGLVPMARLNWGAQVAPGDILIGLASTGVHSNGFSLARRALFGQGKLDVTTHVAELGRTVGEALLEPTRIYVREAMELFAGGVTVKALCHITGDGLLNLNRVGAEVGFEIDALPPAPPLFDLIAKSGKVDRAEMYKVFNMGIGMCLVVPPKDVDAACTIARKHGAAPHVIGRAVKGPDKAVRLVRERLMGRETGFEPF